MAESSADLVLAIRGLRVVFPARNGEREVVHGVDVDVHRGRVTALVGESGSGKSVTALSVLRLLPARTLVAGSVDFGGTDLLTAPLERLRDVRGAGVGMVFQEPMAAWNPVLTIESQIVEALRAHRHTRSAAMREHVLDLLAGVGLDDPGRIASSYPHQLSGGQLQRAMVAMATCAQPDVIIADEPTTALDVTVQAGVLDVFRTLAANGTGILLITHDMGVVADLADDVVVMRDGLVVERGSVAEVLLAPREPYTQRLLAAVPRPVASVAEPEAALSKQTTAARLQNVRVEYRSATRLRRSSSFRAVDDVSLAIPAGRTLGLVGESGSGKSTLARVLAGLLRPSDGTVVIGETVLDGRRSTLREVQRTVGVVFQDPGSSLNPKRTVGWSIGEPLRLASWSNPEISDRIAALLEAVELPADFAGRYPHQLSGGQRQRIAIARALALRPSLLVADEPTSALDVSVQATILDLLRTLQAELGFGCLFVSHDLAVVGAIAHRVAVLHDGRLVEEGPAGQVLTDPHDDYTRRLLAAAPVADPGEQRRRREQRAHDVAVP